MGELISTYIAVVRYTLLNQVIFDKNFFAILQGGSLSFCKSIE